MKSSWILIAAFFSVVSTVCFALPGYSMAAEPTEESRFHLLSMKCEQEADEGAETTPQSPPLNVDDPGTPGCNKWELNFVADGDLAKGQNTWEVPLLDINYGVGDNLQFKYEVPYLSSSGEASASAVGESKAGVKYMFFEDETSKSEIAVYPQASFVSSSSDAVRKGLATPGKVFTLPILFSTRIGKTPRGDVDFTANFGYNLSTKSDTTDFISGAVAVGTAVFSRVSFMGELSTRQGLSSGTDGSRENLLLSNVGVIGTLSRKFFLLGSVGHSLYASDQLSHSYALGGVRFILGGI